MKRYSLALFTILSSLPLYSHAACKVPDSLSGKVFVNKTDSSWSPLNPNADSMFRLEFSDKKYTSHFLKVGKKAEGTYQYKTLSPSVAAIEVREQFGGETTEFKLTLVCLNDVSGTFIYNQEKGAIKPDVRQNTGIYTIQ